MVSSTQPITPIDEMDNEDWSAFDADAADYQRDLDERCDHTRSTIRTEQQLDDMVERKSVLRAITSAVFDGYPELTDNEIAVMIMWCSNIPRAQMANVLINENGTEGISTKRVYQIFENALKKINRKTGVKIKLSMTVLPVVKADKPPVTMKRCPHCERTLPASEYHRNAASYDGLTAVCKPCKADEQRRYIARKRARMLQAAGD